MYYSLSNNSLVEIKRNFNNKLYTGSSSYDYTKDFGLQKKEHKNSPQHRIKAIEVSSPLTPNSLTATAFIPDVSCK